MSNLEMYNSFSQPPDWAMKKIKGGRTSGMTDISPQWRIEALTERFGPCGVGWKYNIINMWTVEANGQIGVYVHITLQYKTNAQNGWSDPIPGVGGNMLLVKEKNGMHYSDEGYKMALTDAISVACKALGIGANVYKGMCDSKYQLQNNYNQQPQNQYNYNQSGNYTNNPTTQQPAQTTDQRAITSDEIENCWNGKIYKGNVVYINNQKIRITPIQAQELTTHPKFIPA